MLLRILRVLRILRILRVLKSKGAKQLRTLIMTLIFSFPALWNVGRMLALLIFIYSVLGVQLFTFVVYQDEINGPSLHLPSLVAEMRLHSTAR